MSSAGINLSWVDAAVNEDRFNVERGTDGTTFTQIDTVTANTTVYSDTGLTASTKYYYRVRANNSSGDSAYSNTANATTQAPAVTAPSEPTTLSAAALSSTAITLTWTDGSNNEDGFNAERGTDGTTFTQIGTVTANTTAYSDTGLTASTKYYYRVRAHNSSGDSAYSNTASATTQAPAVTAPSEPTTLSAAALSSTAITLTWTDGSNNEDGFNVERGTDGTTFTQLGTITANTTVYSDTGLTAFTKYYYRVRAHNSAGASTYSNTADATTPSTIKLPKTGQLTSYGTGSIDDGALQKGVAWPNPRFIVTHCDAAGPCADQSTDCDSNTSTDIVTDSLTGLMWTTSPDSTARTWQAALDYVGTMNSVGGLCGHTDWVLPNRNELRSLVNYGQADMAAWLESQGFNNVPTGSYWTSSTLARNADGAWWVGLGTIITCAYNPKTYVYYIWPVRSGQ